MIFSLDWVPPPQVTGHWLQFPQVNSQSTARSKPVSNLLISSFKTKLSIRSGHQSDTQRLLSIAWHAWPAKCNCISVNNCNHFLFGKIPGQVLLLHGVLSWENPSQRVPLFWAGILCSLFLDIKPPPQVTEQFDQLLHCPHLQSTEERRRDQVRKKTKLDELWEFQRHERYFLFLLCQKMRCNKTKNENQTKPYRWWIPYLSPGISFWQTNGFAFVHRISSIFCFCVVKITQSLFPPESSGDPASQCALLSLLNCWPDSHVKFPSFLERPIQASARSFFIIHSENCN